MTTNRASIIIGCLLLPTTISAQLVQTVWNLTVSSRYNYVTGEYDQFTPFSGTLTITFPSTVSSATQYNEPSEQVVITDFGGVLDTVFSSPVASLIPADPYGLATPYGSYTFPNVSAYAQGTPPFIVQFASQANTMNYNSTQTDWWEHHIELRASSDYSTPPSSGVYAFTTQSLLAYLNAYEATNGIAYFDENYEQYDETTDTALAGYDWEGSASLTSVELVTAPSLAFTLSGNSLQLSWPTNFILQSTTNLIASNSWNNVLLAPTVSNNQYILTINTTNGNQFFRLKWNP